MEEIICILYKPDGETLAKFIKEKLSTVEINIETDVREIQDIRSSTHYKINVILISPQLLRSGDLAVIRNFEKNTSILVLVGTTKNEFKRQALKQNVDCLLDWFIYSLEESDVSARELLVSIISLYENDSLVELSSDCRVEEDMASNINSMEIVEQALDESSDNNVPERDPVQFNAVKHVFRKDDRVFLLLKYITEADVVVNVYDDGSFIQPEFINSVYCYSFKWKGDSKESFSVQFKNEDLRSENIRDELHTPTHDIVSPESPDIDSVATLETDDSPYDVLPPRNKTTISSLSNEPLDVCISERKKTDDTDQAVQLDATEVGTTVSLDASLHTGSDIAQASSIKTLQTAKEYTEDYSDGRISLSEEKLPPRISAETRCICSTNDFAIGLQNENNEESQISSEMVSKHDTLRLLLEQEIARVNDMCGSTNEDNEVILRHRRYQDIAPIIGRIEDSVSRSERAIVSDGSATNNDGHGSETSQALETIVEKSGTHDKYTTLLDGGENVEAQLTTSRKPGFSFRQQLKKIMHRSNSEPKMRVGVAAVQNAEKAKVLKSFSDSGSQGNFKHSASAAGLSEISQNPEIHKNETLKKKRENKSQVAKMQRKNSIRIQHILEDNSMTVPVLTVKTKDELL